MIKAIRVNYRMALNNSVYMILCFILIFFTSIINSPTLVLKEKTISPTKLYIIINIPDLVQLNVGKYQNPLVELDPFFFFSKQKNNYSDTIELSFSINKPELIEFYLGDKRRYRFYFEPESVNNIIIGENYYSIEGPTEKENILLRELGFNKASLKQPKYSSPADLNQCLNELAMLCDSMKSRLTSAEMSNDFKKFIDAEMFGFNYFWKSNLLNKFKNDTIGIDTLPQTLIENIRSLYNFNFIDENRSRYYLNSASLYFYTLTKLQLSKKEEDNFHIYITAASNNCNALFSKLPNLHRILHTSILSSAVYLAKTQSEIEFSEYLYNIYIENTTMQEEAFEIIKADLDRKIKRFNLNKLENFNLNTSFDTLDSLSNFLTSKINIINFWASWCRPCVEKMPELMAITKTNNINLVNVNIWSSKASWEKLIEQKYDFKTNSLFADKEVSAEIATKCSIIQFPIYMVVDEELNILSIIESYPDLLRYMQSID